MKTPKKFWEQEAKEKEHKDIKKELEKAAGKKKAPKNNKKK